MLIKDGIVPSGPHKILMWGKLVVSISSGSKELEAAKPSSLAQKSVKIQLCNPLGLGKILLLQLPLKLLHICEYTSVPSTTEDERIIMENYIQKVNVTFLTYWCGLFFSLTSITRRNTMCNLTPELDAKYTQEGFFSYFYIKYERCVYITN